MCSQKAVATQTAQVWLGYGISVLMSSSHPHCSTQKPRLTGHFLGPIQCGPNTIVGRKGKSFKKQDSKDVFSFQTNPLISGENWTD